MEYTPGISELIVITPIFALFVAATMLMIRNDRKKGR